MKAKLDKLSELSKLLSTQDGVKGDLVSLFGRFGLGRLLRRLCLEKQCGVSAVQLILSLCLFRINGESIHSIYNKRFYNLLETGKNCYYRMLNRSSMDWRKLHSGMVSRFFAILRKEQAEEGGQPRYYIFDDTTLEKRGMKMERVSRVFDHVKGNCVLGYKLLLMCFFDGRSTLPVDFSIHREKGKKDDYGLTKKQLKAQYTKKREKGSSDYIRLQESDLSKIESAIGMMKRAWKSGIHADYALTDSWFTCESLIAAVRKLGKGCVHFVGLAKMGNTRYKVHGRLHNAPELVALHERESVRTCRKYKCRYISLKASYGQQPVRIFLIKYGRNSNWNILITSDLSLNFVKCFELYQIRWNIEVLIKENKEHLGLGNYQGVDFNGQIADCTLCFLTYIVVSLHKRFSDYETWGGLFAALRDELMAFTLWQRVLECLRRMLEVLAQTLGQTPESLLQMMIENETAAQEFMVMLKAVEAYRAEKEAAT